MSLRCLVRQPYGLVVVEEQVSLSHRCLVRATFMASGLRFNMGFEIGACDAFSTRILVCLVAITLQKLAVLRGLKLYLATRFLNQNGCYERIYSSS